MTEQELLMCLKEGDKNAFNILYHKYRNDLYNSIFKMVKQEDQSADLLQELFIKIWQKRAEIDPELPFKAYVYRITQNMVYEFFRSVARDRKREEHLIARAASTKDYTPVDDEMHYKESIELVDRVLAQLPTQCRQVFIYCKIEGRGYQETADLLGISKATVNNHITRANQLLKVFKDKSNYLPLMLIAIESWIRK